MNCPNCDNVINAVGCQGCGWKTGDPFPAHRLAADSAHPLKGNLTYPPMDGGTKHVKTVNEPPLPKLPSPTTVAIANLQAQIDQIHETLRRPVQLEAEIVPEKPVEERQPEAKGEPVTVGETPKPTIQ